MLAHRFFSITSIFVFTFGAPILNPAARTYGQAPNHRLDSSDFKIKPTPPLVHARFGHSATVLPSGQVLVLGGLRSNENSRFAAQTETFDPTTHQWVVDQDLRISAVAHTATLLDDGTILLAGGYAAASVEHGNPNLPTTRCRLINARNRSSKLVGTLTTPRALHTATRLESGRVLVVGGSDGASELSSCEIFDPTSQAWAESASMASQRVAHTATRLNDGRVLVCGGYSDLDGVLNSCEIYDPKTASWTVAAPMTERRFEHSAVLLQDGRVLVAGGNDVFPQYESLASTEIYDPIQDTWTSTGAMTDGRRRFAMAALGDGQVVAYGGAVDDPIQADGPKSIEVFSPVTSTWQLIGVLPHVSEIPTAVSLANGSVLVCGGSRDGLHANRDSTLIRVRRGGLNVE